MLVCHSSHIEAIFFITFLTIFILFIIAVSIKILLSINRSEIDLQEKVVHIGLETIRVGNVGATLVYQSLLLHRDHISHVDTDFKLSECLTRPMCSVLFALLWVEEDARLADLQLAFDFAVLRAIVHVLGLYNFFISHKEGKLSKVLLRDLLFLGNLGDLAQKLILFSLLIVLLFSFLHASGKLISLSFNRLIDVIDTDRGDRAELARRLHGEFLRWDKLRAPDCESTLYRVVLHVKKVVICLISVFDLGDLRAESHFSRSGV